MIYDFALYISATLGLYVGSTLVGNWIWELWIKRSNSKEKRAVKLKTCRERIKRCLHELDYNSTPGIGGARCPFITEAQRELLYSEEAALLGEELQHSLKVLIIEAGRSNGETTSATRTSVKIASQNLKDLLQQRMDSLTIKEFQ